LTLPAAEHGTAKGYPVRDEDIAHLSPARHEHINPYGKYRFDIDLRQHQLRPFRAPALAGLLGLTAKDVRSLLQTGKRVDGSSPNPPMPPFRLTPEDAAAVVAYLESLAP